MVCDRRMIGNMVAYACPLYDIDYSTSLKEDWALEEIITTLMLILITTLPANIVVIHLIRLKRKCKLMRYILAYYLALILSEIAIILISYMIMTHPNKSNDATHEIYSIMNHTQKILDWIILLPLLGIVSMLIFEYKKEKNI